MVWSNQFPLNSVLEWIQTLKQ